MIFIDKKRTNKKFTTGEFIERAHSVHDNKFDYSKTEYTHSKLKVLITCKVHGDFEQVAANHLHGIGCPHCAKITRSQTRTKTTSEFIESAKRIHSDTYNYDKSEYTCSAGYLTVTCRKHGDFRIRANNHLNGKGCSKCSKSGISKIASEWLDSLDISTEHREVAIKEFPNRPLDAYVAETNTVYQFHGDYWHGNSKVYDSNKINAHNKKTFGELYESTIEWDQKIRDLNYNLIVIWESDYRKNSLISSL